MYKLIQLSPTQIKCLVLKSHKKHSFPLICQNLNHLYLGNIAEVLYDSTCK